MAHTCSAYDAMQGKKGIDDSKMAIFRGIHVSDWLGIIMQVGNRVLDSMVLSNPQTVHVPLDPSR
jgi:hypothetical protein